MKNADYKYELMVIHTLEHGLAEAKKSVEDLKKQLEKHGEIFFEDIWGEKDFAYTMKKQNKGFYAVFNFSYDPAQIKSLSDALRLDKDMIRHLLVKVPFKYEPKTLEELNKAHEKEIAKAEVQVEE